MDGSLKAVCLIIKLERTVSAYLVNQHVGKFVTDIFVNDEKTMLMLNIF